MAVVSGFISAQRRAQAITLSLARATLTHSGKVKFFLKNLGAYVPMLSGFQWKHVIVCTEQVSIAVQKLLWVSREAEGTGYLG